jgi:hypothetical protein
VAVISNGFHTISLPRREVSLASFVLFDPRQSYGIFCETKRRILGLIL